MKKLLALFLSSMFLAVSFFNSSSMIPVYADNTSSNENAKLMAKIEATYIYPDGSINHLTIQPC